MAERAKILYLYAQPAEAGLDHVYQQRLVDALRERHEVTLRLGVLTDEQHEKAAETLRRQMIGESELVASGHDVIVIEGSSRGLRHRIRAEALRRFVDEGGVVLLFLTDVTGLAHGAREYRDFFAAAGLPAVQHPRSAQEFPDIHLAREGSFDSEVVVGWDERHQTRHPRLYAISLDEEYAQYIDPVCRPALRGIKRIVASGSVQMLVSPAKIVLAANPDTRMLTTGDLWWDGAPFHVLATMNDGGRGVGITITGAICDDQIVSEHATDSIPFVLNLLDEVLRRQRGRSTFLSLTELVHREQTGFHAPASEEAPTTAEHAYAEFAERLHELIMRHPDAARFRADAEELLKNVLSDVWEALDPSSRLFLVTGESIFRAFRDASEIDFAATALEFAKALERELNCGLVAAFRDHVRTLPNADSLREEFGRLPQLRVLHEAVFSGWQLTLGQISFELERTADVPSGLHDELCSFLRERSAIPGFWLDRANMVTHLQTVTRKYRNGSAHTKNMTLAVCGEWRSWLVGLDGRESLLRMVMRALPRRPGGCDRPSPSQT